MVQDTYKLMLWIGERLGCEVNQLLEPRVNDVRGKDYLSMRVGPLRIQRTCVFTPEIKTIIERYTEGRTEALFVKEDGTPIHEEDVICDFPEPMMHLSMQRYYRETGDIYYPMHLMQTSEEDTIGILSK